MGLDAMIFVFWISSFKPAFSLSSFTFIKKLFNSSSLSAIRVVLNSSISFPGVSDSKESACNTGELSLIPELGRYPEEGNGCPLQYSCLDNSMDWGAWQATVQGVAKSRIWVNAFHYHYSYYYYQFLLQVALPWYILILPRGLTINATWCLFSLQIPIVPQGVRGLWHTL